MSDFEKAKEFLRKQGAIIKLQGQEFVTFRGLLNLGHMRGIKSLTTEEISFDNEGDNPSYLSRWKCTIVGKDDSVFTAHGDASPKNVSKMVAPALLRMGETRAIARCLRFFTGFGLTAIDELGERNG
jgi:hypothetical protein